MWGELNPPVKFRRAKGGSSPRVGGIAFLRVFSPNQLRIIPACGGNCVANGGASGAVTDHPRVWGELSETQTANILRGGSSPRVGGIDQIKKINSLITRIIPACGGNCNLAFNVPFSYRIIPACGGNWGRNGTQGREIADHPRVWGELEISKTREAMRAGSSPRVGGIVFSVLVSFIIERIIPACGGN